MSDTDALSELSRILGAPIVAATWNEPLRRWVLWRSPGFGRQDCVVLELNPPGQLRRCLVEAFGEAGRLTTDALVHVVYLARLAAGDLVGG